MKTRINRITTHRDRHGVAYWRFHYAAGTGYARLTERYTRGDFLQRNGIWVDWLRKLSTGILIDIPEMTVVVQKGRTGDLVQDFTLRGTPETVAGVEIKVQKSLF